LVGWKKSEKLSWFALIERVISTVFVLLAVYEDLFPTKLKIVALEEHVQ